MWLNTKNDDKQLCKFWERKKKNVSATHCCKACMESSCDECKALHELVAILQSHIIVQIWIMRILTMKTKLKSFVLNTKGRQSMRFAFCVVVFAMLNIIDRVRGYGEMY